MKSIAYTGTFDPFHIGHESIIETLEKTFNKVYIFVFNNPSKKTVLDIESRTKAIKEIYEANDNVIVIYSHKSLADTLIEYDVNILARGVRNSEDVVIEMQRATMFRKIQDIETIFIPSKPDTSFISSSIIRELISLNKDIDMFVSAQIDNIYKLSND